MLSKLFWTSIFSLFFAAIFAGSYDKVRLADVQTLTLHARRYTSGRRSASIPQLNCVGGSARGKFSPQVVQCYNRGWDGNDVQWECKTDMDNDFRFGNIEVVCEGFDYPDDPYILKGSCGLEYSLEYTKQGHHKKHSTKGHDYGYHQPSHHSTKSKFGFGDLFPILFICVIGYIIYRTCITSPRPAATDAPPPYPGEPHSTPSAPPGPGFRPEYQPGYGCDDTQYRGGASQDRPGFWTGMGAGGILGYLFGGRNSGYGHTGYGYDRRGYNQGSWWGPSTRTGSAFDSFGTHTAHGSSSNADSSTGTRTASGFGGTRRR